MAQRPHAQYPQEQEVAMRRSRGVEGLGGKRGDEGERGDITPARVRTRGPSPPHPWPVKIPPNSGRIILHLITTIRLPVRSHFGSRFCSSATAGPARAPTPPTNICARQMVERQALVSTVSASEIELLTYDDILTIARGAFARKEEDVNFIVLLLEFSLKPALIGVKEFLGHDSQVHGGTLGDPITQPEYVRLLTKDLSFRVLNNSEFFARRGAR